MLIIKIAQGSLQAEVAGKRASLLLPSGERVNGRVSYASLLPNPIVNFIEVKNTPALSEFIKRELGKDISSKEYILFSLPKEEKEKIVSYVKSAYDAFVSALLRGEIKLTVRKVGVDDPYRVVSFLEPVEEFNGLPAWDLLYTVLDEAGLYRVGSWGLDLAEGADCTERIVEMLRNRLNAPKAAPRRTVSCWECGREYTEEEARQRGWDPLSGEPFYCGC